MADIVAKQIPDMTDDELAAARDHYGPDHKRTAKITKEINRRALTSKLKPKPNTKEDASGTQTPETQQAEAQRQEAPAAAAIQPVAQAPVAPAVKIKGPSKDGAQAHAAGRADFAAGKPRVPPSYLTSVAKKRDWINGWDTAAQAAKESGSKALPNDVATTKGLGEQLAELNAKLERQGAVQNANTRAQRDAIRMEIAKQDFPDILKAVDDNLDVAEELNRAFKYAGDEPKANTIARILKKRGITTEYQARWTERLMAEEVDTASVEQPGTKPEAVVKVPEAIGAAIQDQMEKQKRRVMRLRGEESGPGLNLERKAAAQTKTKAAEATLRQMRTSVFDAEDAAIKAIETGKASEFEKHADLFPAANDAIRAMLGQNDELDAETRAYEDGLTAQTRADDVKKLVDAAKKQDKEPAPGTRINGPAERAAADRLSKLVDVMPAVMTPRSHGARAQVKAVIEQLRKDQTVVSIIPILETASQRFMSDGHAPFSEVVDEVIDTLGGETVDADMDLMGFTKTPTGNGSFTLSDSNMRVTVEPTGTGFQARMGSAESGPRLTEQQAIGWAAALRDESIRIQKQETKGPRVIINKLGKDGLTDAERAAGKPSYADKPAKAPAAPKQPSSAELRAQADLNNALADLGDIFSKPFKAYITPEQEQKLLPVLTRVLDAAFRLGYAKFKDAAKFALDKISAALGADVADALTLDHLQGAYIAMSGGKPGTDTKRAVIGIEDKAEILSHTAMTDAERNPAPADGALENAGNSADTGGKEPQNGPSIPGEQGSQALENVAPAKNGGTQEGGRVRGGRSGRGAGSKQNDSGIDEPGVSGPRSGGSGSTSVRAPTPRKRGKRGGLGASGTGADGIGLPGERGPESVDPADLFNQPTEPVSANNIQAVNFRITPELRLGKGGENEKFRDNIAAIRTLKAIEAEGRRATSAEQSILARYVGWGGLANAFPAPESKQWKDEWKARGAELAELLTKKEYDLARRSTLDSHYTSETIVSGMWDAARRMGFKGGMALESSMGSGNFLGLIPQDMAGSTRFIGIEYDSLTSRIAEQLYPQETVLNAGLQNVPLPDKAFDLNIGNPPFGDQSLRFQFKPEFNRVSIHNQFFLAGIDSLKPGGVQMNVVSRYLLDAMDKTTRTMLAKKAKLVAAIRLPDTAFKENARTSVVTDIVILQKLSDSESSEMVRAFDAAANPFKADKNATPQKNAEDRAAHAALAAKVPSWVEVGKMSDPLGGDPMTVNNWFIEHPEMILGTLERSGKMQFKNDITVRPHDADLSGLLAEAISRLPENIMQSDRSAIAASLERHKAMSDGLRISLSGQEAGSIVVTKDGTLEQVVERETPEGEYELAKRLLTPESPWSESLYQDANGNWYTITAKLDEAGNKVKLVKNGKATKLNVYERNVFASTADIPKGLLLGPKRYERLVKLVGLRDLMVAQINLETEDAPTAEMEGNRALLAKAYNDFVESHGPISRQDNSSLVANMPDGALVQALELEYRKAITPMQAQKLGEKARPESATPAPILAERVIPRYEPPTKAATPADALSISLSETGRVDLARMAALLGKTEEEVTAEMFDRAEKPLIFKDPELGQWVTRNDYLTGQVKKKLHAAQAARLEKNIAELEAVQPEPWGAENVTVLLGSTFVPPKIYEDFLLHVTGTPARVSFSPATNSYAVMPSGSATAEKVDEFGADGIRIADMVSEILNSRSIRITKTNEDGKEVFDEERTALALIKAKQIRNEFTDWVFMDSDRRRTLVDLFNERFNTRVNRQHDGSHLTLPGKVPDAILKMRRHQLNTIWRGISERFMLIDHVVGAGKTFTAIARVMERRRMGLSRKPAIIVPNHMVEQFTADVYRLYPGAKVLAAGQKDFEKQRRRKLFAKIASGDWDVVIIPHSSFGFIGIAPETEERYLEREIEIAEQAIADAWDEAGEQDTGKGRKPFNVKQAERLRDKLTARMAGIKGRGKKDRLLTFEQMGIDDLTVDEAHEFKNLFYSTRLTNVKGMGNPSGSQKAFDLYSKVRVLRESPSGTVTFMTGTPISNSAVEMFNMMRYLAADELKELGLEHFDAWRAQFVSTDPGWEPTETVRLKEVNRLGRSWSNMRSLMDLYYSFTDSVSNDDIRKAYAEDNNGEKFPIPDVMGGDRRSVVVQPTDAQISLLNQTIQDFDSLPYISDPYERNKERLRLMDRARKLSLDVRAAVRGHDSKEKGGKLEKIADEAARIYKKWDAEKGTQLIFLDRSVPKAQGDDKIIKEYDALIAERNKALAADDEDALQKVADSLEKFDPNEIEELRAAQAGGWNAYQQIKDNLIAAGIPANEIRFIQEANNDAQKQALFDAVNAGEVRILIGSTPRMGAGTNVQKRLVGLHHADVTWKPSDIEQREGRIIRQGNLFATPRIDGAPNPKFRPDFEVEILAYATERTIDAKMWSLNATKLKTINAIRNYDGSFSMDFEDEDSVSMAEMAALASGNPLLMERVKLTSDIDKLELLKRQHQRKMWGFKGRLDDAERAIRRAPEQHESMKRRADEAEAGQRELDANMAARSVTVEGAVFKTYSEAAKAVQEAVELQQAGDPNGKISIKVGERRLTSLNGALEAVSDALGDSAPFLGEIAGVQYIGRTAFAREIAKAASDALAGMEDGSGSKVIATGKLRGFTFEASLEKNRYGSAQVELALVDANGRTVGARSSRPQSSNDAKFVTSSLTTPLSDLDNSVHPEQFRYLARRALEDAAKAEKEIPDLREKAARPFAGAQELAEKTERLNQVISLLAVDHVPAPASMDGDLPMASADNALILSAQEFKNNFLTEPNFTDGFVVTTVGGGRFYNQPNRPFSTRQEAADWIASQAPAFSRASINVKTGRSAAETGLGVANGPVYAQRRGQDAPSYETQAVQSGIEGKSLIQAAQFVASTGSPAQREIAKRVVQKLLALQSAGVTLDLKIAHRGDMVPAGLINSRGYTETGFDDKGRDIVVWLNGADVTSKVGTDYETLLHEMVHAATTGAILHGASVKNSVHAKSVADLKAVSSAIERHINDRFRQADAGSVELTEFEKDMRASANNAFRNMDEVVAWALSSSEAQQYLESIPYQGGSMWTRFVQAVREFLGLSAASDTALSEVLRVAEAIMNPQDANFHATQAFWHKRGIKMAQQQASGSKVLQNVRNERAEPFYSELSRQIEAANINAAPVIGWKAMLKGLMSKGVKADEITWSGIEEWLDLQTGKVTKAQVLEYLNANGVQVQETVLGESKSGADEWEVQRNGPEDYDVIDGNGEVVEAGFLARSTAQEFIDDEQKKGGTKYSQYTLPGGENYREVLLTLPVKTRQMAADDALKEIERRRMAGEISNEEADRLSKEAYRAKRTGAVSEVDVGSYQSSHWQGTPNVLAHIRVNDRTDADGARVLFVEELQSDWQQSARKQGIQKKLEPVFSLDDQRVRLVRRDEGGKQLTDVYLNDENVQTWKGSVPDDYIISDLNDVIEKRAKIGVPNAPFIDKTDKWLTLALKRIVKMAVDGGYDRVAFVNGEQSADRYDLSKQVKSIEYMRNPSDGTYKVMVLGLDGQGAIWSKARATLQELEDHVGKEIAQKMERYEGRDLGIREVNYERSLSGDGLKVGGEGMKAFYDQIVPNTLKTVLKKVGGGGLEAVDIGTSVAARVQDKANPDYKPLTQPGFTITPAMQEKASNGLPLFRRQLAKFSRRAQQQANNAVQSIVDKLTADWQNKPEIVIAFDMQDEAIPENVRLEDAKQRLGGAFGNPEGFYYRGVVYLLSSQLATEADIARVLAHESFGHYGLHGSYGKALKPILQQIATMRRADVIAVARQRGLVKVDGNNRPIVDVKTATNAQVWAAMTDSHKLQSAEEVLAEMAQTTPQAGFVKRAVAAIRQWLREHGFNLKLTDNDIIVNYILPARGWVERGPGGGGQKGGISFARGAQSKNAENTRYARGWYDRFVRLLPDSYRNDPYRREPLPAEGGDVQRASEVRAKVDALNKQIRGPKDKKGYGPVSLDSLGNLQVDAREATHSEIVGEIKALADEVGYGIAVTGVQTRLIEKFREAGFESEISLAAIADRITGVRAEISDETSVYSVQALGTIMSYKPRGFPMALFSRSDQTQTEAFKRWFGDSKAVDAEGKPLVVYHGTNSDLSAFASDRANYFTADPGAASVYAEGFGAPREGANVYPVYLSIQRPKWMPLTDSAKLTAADLAAIKEEGFDGVFGWTLDTGMGGPTPIAREVGTGQRGMDKIVTEAIPLSPEQIKSAIGNNGDFDPANPDIRFNRAATENAAAEKAAVEAATDTFWEDQRATSIRQELYDEYSSNGTVDGRAISQDGLERDEDGDLTDDGYNALDMRTRDAIEHAVIDKAGKIESLSDIDSYGTHMQAYVAAQAWLDAMGVQFQKVGSAGSRYLEINSKDYHDGKDTEASNESLKLRFSTHEQQSRQHTTTDLNWVEGSLENDLSDMLDKARRFLSGESGLGERVHFSRAATARDMKQKASEFVNDYLAAPGKLDAWSKTVGTQYHLAQRQPAFKPVYEAIQAFIGDVSYYATEAANKAPSLLPRLETWRDALKSPVSGKDAKAIAAPIFEGTLNWTRDDNGQPVEADDVQSAGIVWTDEELKYRFDMSGGQIKLYREFRESVDDSLSSLAKSHMLYLAGKDAADLKNAVMEAATVAEASQMLQDRMAEVAANGSANEAAAASATGAKIIETEQQTQRLIQRGYAPLTRFGNHTLDVLVDGERQYFGLFESAKAAAEKERELRVKYPDAEITRGTMSEQSYKLFAGVTPETAELFGEMMGVDDKEAFQEYIKLAKSTRSAMKRMIQREGIAGFSEDAGRVLAGFVYSNARQTARNLHVGDMDRAASAIPKEQGELKDHAINLVQYIKNPTDEAQAVRGLLFAQYIGGSVASAMVNMTQPFTMSLPWLSQFGGLAKAGKQMAAAVKDVGKHAKLEPALAAAMKRAEEDGTVSPQEVFDLMKQAQGKASLTSGDGTASSEARAMVNNLATRVGFGWGKMFSAAEQFNRRVTFIAAYRTAVERGMADPDAFARQAIHETQGVYNRGNRPQWARGAIGGTLFTFKQYSISYMEMLHRMATRGAPGSKERAEGMRAIAYSIGILILLSGVGGAPGADDLDDLLSGLGQAMGYNFDSRSARRKYLTELFGDDWARFVERGVSGLPGAPIDVSGRMGLGNLIPGTGLLTRKEDHTRDVLEIAGPVGDLSARAFEAAGKLVRGEVAGAATTIAPRAAANLVQAGDMMATGMYRDRTGKKVVSTDTGDALAKAIGFQPNAVKRVQDSTIEVQRMIGLNKLRETEIADKWAMGLFEKDQDKVKEARDELAKWNEDNPSTPIRIQFNQIMSRLKKMNQSKTERIAKTSPVEIRQQVREALAQ